jgi:hypothetical protein
MSPKCCPSNNIQHFQNLVEHLQTGDTHFDNKSQGQNPACLNVTQAKTVL